MVCHFSIEWLFSFFLVGFFFKSHSHQNLKSTINCNGIILKRNGNMTFVNPAQNHCKEFMHVLIKHSCDIAVI